MRRFILAILLLMSFALSAKTRGRSEIAVTFDDLPLSRGPTDSIAIEQEITRKLVGLLQKRKIPVTAFVVANKLESAGALDPRRLALLEAWLDAGFELGNHTYSHRDLHTVSAVEFKVEIARGEAPLRDLLDRRGKPLRWFRHPFLHTGRSLAIRDEVQGFLAARGSRVAPVTIDNSEWIFSLAWDRATKGSVRKRLKDEYIRYMLAKVDHYDTKAAKLFGRAIRHTLLVHSNALNAEVFGELADRLASRGHTFITLDRAMEDPAYASKDTWTGGEGLSWLDRWALTRNLPKSFFGGEPRTPKWVLDMAGVAAE